jgi:hypothetical protein
MIEIAANSGRPTRNEGMKKCLLMASAIACASFTVSPVWAGEDPKSCIAESGLWHEPGRYDVPRYTSGRVYEYDKSRCAGAIKIHVAVTPSLKGGIVDEDKSFFPATYVLDEKNSRITYWAQASVDFPNIALTSAEWAATPGVVWPNPPPPTEYLDSIIQRTTLNPGDSLRSLNRKYVLKMQADGNLVLYNDKTGSAIWNSGTQAYPGAHAILQADGHFSVYDATGIWRWGSWTSYSGINARLTVGDDGNMRILQPETYWWNSGTQVSTYAAPASPTPSSPAGQSLWPVGTTLTPSKGTLQSANGENKLIMQADGNLVLYRKGVATWNSGTYGNANAYAKMWDSGDVVVYNSDGRALWNSATWGHPGASMLVQDDGNLVLYTWKSIWATNTAGK